MSEGHDHGHSDFVPTRYLLAEFPSPQALLAGTTKMREAGYKNLDTHTPFPIHGIEEALGLKRPKIPLIVLCGAIAGACLAYAMIYFMNVFDWPLNIGNRPPHGPPANIPITFELAVLLGGGSSFLGVFALSRLPQPYHPLFESEDFLRASIDAFFLSVELSPGTDVDRALADIRAAGAISGEIVEESER
jgi:ActD protein